MAWKEDGVVGNLVEAVGDGVVELLRVAAGEVGPTAAVEEQGVARDELVPYEETLAAGRVARSVDQFDLDLADLHHITGVVAGEHVGPETGRLRDELDLRALQMDRHVDPVEQTGDAIDLVTHHVPADVVGVIVGSEHADEAHLVCLQDVEQVTNVVGRVDDDGFTGLPIPDEVTEVDHLSSDQIPGREVSAAEQLAEVEASIHVRTLGSIGWRPRAGDCNGGSVSDELLDNLPWHALTGPQSSFAEGSGTALRYRRPFGVFSATARLDADGWSALGEMIGPGRGFVLFQPNIGDTPTGFTETGRHLTYQMVADGDLNLRSTTGSGVELIELGDDDAAEMVELTELTQPGPFFPETHRLGTYLGVRENGRLIAMAGERLRAAGAAEISAVCTHPDARRRGLAAILTSAMVDVIRGRGDLPLLHVARTNSAAIPVYEQLGFRIRCSIDAITARVDGERQAR